MIDPRIAWFAAGTLLGAVLFGWQIPNMERYDRLSDRYAPRRRRGSNPPPPLGRKPAPPVGPPVRPEPHGGQLFVNNKPQFPPPREIIEDFWPRCSNQTPNPPHPNHDPTT